MNEVKNPNEKTFFGMRMQYWTAKGIMELFEWQDDQKDKLNSKAFEKDEDEFWSVSRRNVVFEISKISNKKEIVVTTTVFNEFDDNRKTKFKTFEDRFEDKYVRTISEYAKVIEDYFTYFEDTCYSTDFGYFDRRNY